jgi:trimethylamine--corrinoid protein Co-methyltransferase
LYRQEVEFKDMTRKGFAGGSFKPLTEKSILRIHQTAMRIIEEIGFEVNSDIALELFERGGGRVDRERLRVCLPQEKVLELISMAPSEIRLCGQDEKHDILLGGKRVYAGTGGTALYIYHPDTGQKRPATLEDLNTLDGVNQVIRMADMVAGSREALQRRPLISMITCSISPMKMDEQYGDLLVAIAKSGIPLVCPAEPLCGATSPVTLAGNLVIQTVDSLMGVILTQITNPGTPVIFGSVATSIDFGDFKYLAGSVEMGLLNAAGAQMAQFYQLPYYATGGMTDSKVLDAQSGYESAMTSLLCALAGANFIHDAAGFMESALTACYEKFVIDNEILGMVMRAVEGIRVDDDTLAFDLIKQVGPGGNFVAAKHTRKFMRSEHYQPSMSDRNSREKWEAKGGKTTWEKASAMVPQLIANHTYSLPNMVRRRVLSEIAGIID